jgi:hypothetical protein
MTKQEAINYINSLTEDVELEVTVTNRVVSSGEVEKLGISRQLLRYWVATGKVRTIPSGKQKKYLLDDINRLKKL